MQSEARTSSNLEAALAVWHRRKWMGLISIVVFSAVAATTRSLPNVYESTATVLVEHPQTSQGLGGPWAESDLETRLRTISEKILSRSRLYDLITQFNLYPDLRQRTTPEAIVEQMRKDIQIQFNGVRQPTGLEATVAFSLSYRGGDPDTVARVTNALAALYVEENARIRQQQTAGTTEVLKAQVEDARRQLDEQEQKISQFRERHVGELPEQQAANLAAVERLTAQLREVIDRRDVLAKRLEPAGVPDDSVPARLARLRKELTDLRTRYTDEYPDVVRVKQEIADLERRRATVEVSTASQPSDPSNAVEAELAALRNEEHTLRHAIAAYEQHVETAPLMEQELQQLSQGYAAAQQRYQSLLQRYEDAQLAEQMNQRLQTEQFRILDPAVASQQPVGPHRFRLLITGLMVSLAAAIGAAVLAESVDTSFHSVENLRAFTSVPVLVSIPPIVTETDIRRRRRRFGLATAAVAAGVVTVAGASSYLAHTNGALVRLLMFGGI